MSSARAHATLAVLGATLGLAACGVSVPSTEDGEKLFTAMCARCHRADGHGSTELGAPDLTTATFQAAHPDDVIRATIIGGSRTKKMPGFGAGTFTPRQLDALVGHVRALGTVRPDAAR